MANINGSFGLRPLNKLGGGANSTGLTGYTPYEIANGNSDKIYQGQVVIPLASGFIDHAANAAGGTVSHLGVFKVASMSLAPLENQLLVTTGLDRERIATIQLKPLLLMTQCSCM